MNVLIVKLSSIGDVLHSTTTVHNLRLNYPNAHITWLVSPPSSNLLEANPDIDELLIWDRCEFDIAFKNFNLKQMWQSLKKFKSILSGKHFDIVLDIQSLFLTGILCHMVNAPRKIGIHERHEGNSFFMTETVQLTDEIHKVKRYLSVLQPLGISNYQLGLILKIPSRLNDFAQNFWKDHSINLTQPIMFVHMITSWQSKNWFAERYVEVLNSLPNKIQIVFSGSIHDEIDIETVRSQLKIKSISIAGKTELIELATLFQTADLLLTCDTGILYIAEAIGLKTISLWGPTNPAMYGPLTTGHSMIITPNHCKFCCKSKCKQKNNACMKAIDSKIVTKTVLEVFYSSL